MIVTKHSTTTNNNKLAIICQILEISVTVEKKPSYLRLLFILFLYLSRISYPVLVVMLQSPCRNLDKIDNTLNSCYIFHLTLIVKHFCLICRHHDRKKLVSYYQKKKNAIPAYF